MSFKIALITGGSRGLGRSAALNMASEDVGVVITYRDQVDQAETLIAEIEEKGGSAIALKLEVGDTTGFSDFVEELQHSIELKWGATSIDFLVNNAGVGVAKPIADMTESDFDVLMNVHLKGSFFLTQKLLPLINDGGRILNVSSGLTRFSLPGYSAYAAMKGAIEVFTKYLALELGDRRIAVNVIAPGAIETDFGGGVVRDNPEVNQYVAGTTAMGRAGLPEDIGVAISSMLLNESQWMTGQRVEVSGGQSL